MSAARILPLLIVTVLAAAAPPRAGSALQEAIAALAAEAANVRAAGAIAERPDFASRFQSERPIDADQLQKALLRPAHRDRFIDAYVRWQLMSFDPSLPAMDDRQFAQFMDAAPAMVENPRADPKMVDLFRRAENAGPLSPGDSDRLRALARDLDQSTAAAEALNRPALGFREFVASKLPSDGPRGRQWLLERCAATIVAGWPPRQVKAEITKAFTAAAADPSLTAQHKQTLADQAARLVGLQREIIREIEFMADGSLKAFSSFARVDDNDVKRWIARLAGQDSP
jgi:hypothetical protein